MKRRVTLWLAVCLLLCLALGLWQGYQVWMAEPPTPSAVSGESGPSAPVLALFGSSTGPWYETARDAAEDWCDREGWELVEYDCLGLETTQALQVADLEKDGGADLAVLWAVDRQSLEENALALHDQGLTVISLADRPLGPLEVPAGVAGHLGPYRAHILDVAAGFFQEELGMDKGVVILHDMEEDPLEAAAASSLSAAGVRVAGSTYTWGSVDYAQALLGETLRYQSDVGGVLCFSRTGAQGARAALTEAGSADTVKILCMDDSEELMDDLEQGTLDGVLTLREEDLAAQLTDALDRAARGESLGRAPLAVEVRRAET